MKTTYSNTNYKYHPDFVGTQWKGHIVWESKNDIIYEFLFQILMESMVVGTDRFKLWHLTKYYINENE